MKPNKLKIVLYMIIASFILSSNLFSQEYLSSLKDGAIERVENRTAYSKTFINTDGTNTAIIYSNPVHYNDNNGTWLEIDGELEISVSGFTGITNCGMNGYPPSAGITSNCIIRTYIDWSTSSIPDGSTINSASFKLYMTGDDQVEKTLEWYKMPYCSDYEDMYNYCGTETLYGETTSSLMSWTQKFSAADFSTDIQAQLVDDFAAVGIKNDAETTANKYVMIYDENGSSNPKLIVDYDPPASQQLCVSPSSLSFPGTISQETIAVTNCGTGSSFNYTVVTNDSWISISSSSGETPDSFIITAESNPGTIRNGTVTVAAEGVQDSPKTINVVQDELIIPSILYVQNMILSGQEPPFQATNQIYAGNAVTNPPYGDVIIMNGADVTFQSGEKITLNTGFSVLDGADFVAYIETPESFNSGGSNNMIGTNNQKEDQILFQETRLENFLEKNISIHPNPNTGFFNIDFSVPTEEPVSIQVRNIMGKVVFDKKLNGENFYYIDISKHQAGLYYVQIMIGNNQMIIKKVFKQ